MLPYSKGSQTKNKGENCNPTPRDAIINNNNNKDDKGDDL